jgi:hypothetical protein
MKTVHDIGNVCEVELPDRTLLIVRNSPGMALGLFRYSPWDGLVLYFHIFIPEIHMHYNVLFREI